MKIIGTTPDGCHIRQGHGIVTTETYAERDERLEAAAYDLVRNTAPELLQACTGLLAVIAQFVDVDAPNDAPLFMDSGDIQAIRYAQAIVAKLIPDQTPAIPAPGDQLA
jgi:hypothetical protein